MDSVNLVVKHLQAAVETADKEIVHVKKKIERTEGSKIRYELELQTLESLSESLGELSTVMTFTIAQIGLLADMAEKEEQKEAAKNVQ